MSNSLSLKTPAANTCIFKYITTSKIYSSILHPPKVTVYSTVACQENTGPQIVSTLCLLSLSLSPTLFPLSLSLSRSFSHTHSIASFVFQRIQYLSTKSFFDVVELQYDYLEETDNLQLNFNFLFLLLFFFFLNLLRTEFFLGVINPEYCVTLLSR